MKQIEDARADVADDGGLQRGGAERIEAQHFERVAAAGKGDAEFEHRTRHVHRRILGQLREHALIEAVARAAHHHVGFAHQPLGREPELVECGGVDQIDRGAERDP